LITHEFPLDEAPTAYETILAPNSTSLAVLLRYPTTATGFEPKRRVEATPAPAARTGLGVALIGAGNLARWEHLPIIKRTAGVRVRAIQSSSGARGKSYALRFGAEYCASDYEEVLRDPDVHVVVIVSRNPQHAPQALAALHAGKDVFVEKPMALTVEECRALCQAVEETGKRLCVGFNRRFSPSYKEMKKELARRTGPAVLNCSVNSPGISGSYWMADPDMGGAILGEACHFIDLMYWLLDAEPIAVSAFSLPAVQKEPLGENNVAAAFRFADGSVANLTYSTAGSRTSGGERVEAFAPGIGVIAEDLKRVMVRGKFMRGHSSWFAAKGYTEQMRAFFSALQQGRPPDVGVRDGARATIGCLRMLESARTLQPCTIELDADLG
jgi:predicted dehydrogenase